MKARPRSVERKVAEFLSMLFVARGLEPVERIPVLGRTGPDISINEMRLVVDVKSRLQVPKLFMKRRPSLIDGLFCIPLQQLDNPIIPEPLVLFEKSVVVKRWYEHIHEWVLEKCPSGITALVLHRPKMPIGMAVLVISNSQREEFFKRWTMPYQYTCHRKT